MLTINWSGRGTDTVTVEAKKEICRKSTGLGTADPSNPLILACSEFSCYYLSIEILVLQNIRLRL